MNGWKFRVTNTEGAVSATSDVFTLQYPPLSSSSSSSVDCSGLPYATASCPDLGILGISYCSYDASFHPNGCVSFRGCGVLVNGNCVPLSEYLASVSSSSSSVCHFLECGAITPPFAYADCGMIYEPGYIYQMDCNICKCVKSPA
jgi:hypothetical protein